MIKIVKVDYAWVARSFAIFGFKRVFIGSKFYNLPNDQQRAVIAHELGHIRLGHHAVRRWVAPLALICTPFRKALYRTQEFEADDFATECGHGKALCSFLSQNNEFEGEYPKNVARIERIVHNKFYELFP